MSEILVGSVRSVIVGSLISGAVLVRKGNGSVTADRTLTLPLKECGEVTVYCIVVYLLLVWTFNEFHKLWKVSLAAFEVFRKRDDVHFFVICSTLSLGLLVRKGVLGIVVVFFVLVLKITI
jgi:hypothetical protein